MIVDVINFFKKDEKLEREKKILESCGCVCYCPECKDPLNDQADCEDADLVTYKCNNCGATSKWNFDIAPIPILMAD